MRNRDYAEQIRSLYSLNSLGNKDAEWMWIHTGWRPKAMLAFNRDEGGQRNISLDAFLELLNANKDIISEHVIVVRNKRGEPYQRHLVNIEEIRALDQGISTSILVFPKYKTLKEITEFYNFENDIGLHPKFDMLMFFYTWEDDESANYAFVGHVPG